MNKLLSTPLAVAVSAAFVMSVSLTSCANNSKQPETATTQQDINPDDAARIAADKKKSAEKKRAREMQSLPRSSGGCAH